jgi:4-amino-4-deoxy-L-arabinose transferase-like glycosyltransferase
VEVKAEKRPDAGLALLRRLGLAGAPADAGFSRRLIAGLLVLYAVSFAAFYPRVPTNHDEANYIRQTRMLLEGRSEIVQVDAFTGEETREFVSDYPLGTALLTAPWVALAGWRGAFVAACLALVAVVLLTARWIREAGHPPAFALVLLGFPPALVLGRVVMSDVPSAAWAALGLWLFWRGLDRGVGWWLAAGFVAGASLVLRVSNPVLFVPLFAGAVLRREWKSWGLVVGGLAGLAMRLLTMQLYFGNALLERSAYHFAPETVGERLPLYLLGLLVFVPGGLLLSLLYRGRRRIEVVSTIVLFFGFYLFQTYSTVETSLPKRVVLALRYLLPLLPLMAFAMAEATPRLWERLLAAGDAARRQRLQRVGAGLVAVWLGAVGVAAVAVHPAYALWSATQAEIREEIDRRVPDDAVLVTNWSGTKKFVRYLDRHFAPVNRMQEPPDRVMTLLERHPEVFVVLLDRSDSAWWRTDQEENAAFLAGLDAPLELLSDLRPTPSDRLRIWRMSRPPSAR